MCQKRLISLIAMAIFAGCSGSCQGDRAATTSPAQEMDWTGPKKLREWGQTPNGFYGVSAELVLEVWKWDGDTVTKGSVTRLPDVLHTVVLPSGQYLANIADGDYPLVIAAVGTNDVIKSWSHPAGWWYSHTGSSRNGKFAAVMLDESFAKPPPDHDTEKPRHKVGLIEITSGKILWVAELTGRGGGTIGQISVSDDGKYIAIGGWNNGVALVDTSLQQVLWAKRPPEAVSMGATVFSSEGDVLYVADEGGGCVYALDTKTGDVIRRWYATTTGEAIYGHRISCLALSPDGAWVAAGTGPEGQVFLLDTTSSGARPVLLPHGLSTILIVSFSPDSKHLASVAKGKIKVWEIKP